MRLPFTLRILAINLIFLVLPLLIAIFIFFQSAYEEAIKDAKIRIHETANLRAVALSELMPGKEILLKELGYFLKEFAESEEQKAFLTKKLAVVGEADKNLTLEVLRKVEKARFRVEASSEPKEVNKEFYDSELARRLSKQKQTSFIRRQKGLADEDEELLLIVAQLSKPDQILQTRENLTQQLQEIVTQKTDGEKIDFALLNSDGVVFASSKKALVGQFFDPLTPARRKEILESRLLEESRLAQTALKQLKAEDPPFFEFIFGKNIEIAYRAYLSSNGISLVAFSSKEALFTKALKRFLIMYFIFGCILIIGGALAYLLSVWASKPLKQLFEVMHAVSQGKLGTRFKKAPLGFEINQLGQIFNETLERVITNIQKHEDERVKKETFQKEVEIGREVTVSLLPIETPKIEGAEIAGTYLEARDVGGDFFTFFTTKTKKGETVLRFGVTDAAGKGISSALYALSFRSYMLSYSHLYDDLGEALSHANNAFLVDSADSGMFVTTMQGAYNPKSQLLSYFSCGNIPGLLRRKNGELISLDAKGPAIGLKPSERFKLEEIPLFAGDLVLFFTEGLIEVRNEKHESFSEKRLRAFLQTLSVNTAKEALDALTREIQNFCKDELQEQEVTLVVLKVQGPREQYP